jgi:7-carboxy-7-deazaguanine synthase
MRSLLASGCTVLLETSGERPLAAVPKEIVKIVDVKCPSSGEAGSFREENLVALTGRDELKFVLADREDYEFARNFIAQHKLQNMAGRLIFSPAFRKDARGERSASQCLLDPQQLAQWILADALPVRLGLQIHKFIWQPQSKGV